MASISKDDVFQAANSIVGRGEKPTVAKVRVELGSGSFSTITAHMQRWRDEQGVVPSAPLTELPEALEERHRSAVAGIWEMANRIANQKLTEWQYEAERERNEFIDNAGEEVRHLERVVSDLKDENERQIQRNEALLDDMVAARTRHEDAMKEIERLSRKCIDLETLLMEKEKPAPKRPRAKPKKPEDQEQLL